MRVINQDGVCTQTTGIKHRHTKKAWEFSLDVVPTLEGSRIACYTKNDNAKPTQI